MQFSGRRGAFESDEKQRKVLHDTTGERPQTGHKGHTGNVSLRHFRRGESNTASRIDCVKY